MKTTKPLLSIVSLLFVAALGICHLRAEDEAAISKKQQKPDALTRGLLWLQKNQNPDGSWGSENQPLLTGYALAPYFTHGELGDSEQFGTTVKDAVSWLLELSKSNDGRLCSVKKLTAKGRIEHAVCTQVLGEYYALSGDERAKPVIAAAVQHIIANQNKDGGWQFGVEKSDDDFRLTGWNCMALKSAYLTELKLSGVEKSLEAASKWFATNEREDGSCQHIKQSKTRSEPGRITGISIFARLQWNKDNVARSRTKLSMQWLLNEAKKRPLKYNSEEADLETWFYNTQATLLYGGQAWMIWAGDLRYQDVIEHAQNEDGSWPVPGGKLPGLQSAKTKDGAIYRTAICLKMFPPLGRYLPRESNER